MKDFAKRPQREAASIAGNTLTANANRGTGFSKGDAAALYAEREKDAKTEFFT